MKIKRRFIIGILITLLVLFFIFGGIFLLLKLEYGGKFLSPDFISNINLSKIKDGIYYGEYKTMLVSAKVKVYVKSGKIMKIDIVEHKHGRGKKGEDIISRVIEYQSLKVDPISGATVSSKVILKAIENALREKI